jgi:hypothetical protein
VILSLRNEKLILYNLSNHRTEYNYELGVLHPHTTNINPSPGFPRCCTIFIAECKVEVTPHHMINDQHGPTSDNNLKIFQPLRSLLLHPTPPPHHLPISIHPLLNPKLSVSYFPLLLKQNNYMMNNIAAYETFFSFFFLF